VKRPAADIADPKREHGGGDDSGAGIDDEQRRADNFGWATPAVDKAIMSTALSQITRWRG
jgi:hypothetical protein